MALSIAAGSLTDCRLSTPSITYLITQYYSGGDLTNYIKKHGHVENLEHIPEPGTAPQYYPHHRTGGGLAEVVFYIFLRQLSTSVFADLLHHRHS